MDFNLSRQARLILLKTARESIKAALYHKNPELPDVTDELGFDSGCFVTLSIRKHLRGCIGTFSDDVPIRDNVAQMAVQAAFSDPRFAPVSKDEFPMCGIEISVLSPMRPTAIEDVKVGRDGLYIVKGRNRGVLLPQVAVEYGWNETQFIEQTCVKAGLDKDAYKLEDSKLYSFQALVFSEDNLYKTEE